MHFDRGADTTVSGGNGGNASGTAPGGSLYVVHSLSPDFGTGVQYNFSDKITLGAAYQYMNGGDADLDVERGPLAGRLEGDYKWFDVHFVALNVSWRF